MTSFTLDMSPEGVDAICKGLLTMINQVADLATQPVEHVAKKIDVKVEQIEFIMNRQLQQVCFGTLIAIAHASGNELKLTTTSV